MANVNKRIYRKKKNSSLIPILSFLIVCGGISFAVASVWHNVSGDAQLLKDRKADEELVAKEEKENDEHAPQLETNKENPSEDVLMPSEDEAKEEPETTEESENTEEQNPSSTTEQPEEESSDRVRSEYFDDAAFVGDSITQGIQVYDIMSNATVIANTGLNPQSILTEPKIRTADGYVTALEALKADNPKKIYVMLGVNGIGFKLDAFSDLYKQLITSIKEQHPDSIIYIQSMLPVTKAFEDGANNPYNVTNPKINEYNDAIIKIAKDLDVTYLDVASVMKDEDGYLPDEASPTDGIHFGPKYYTKWFDYLKTHTA